jgi:hypothetical protein
LENVTTEWSALLCASRSSETSKTVRFASGRLSGS